MTGRLVAAVDLGASSGRVMVGRVAPNELELTEVHRFANDPVRLPDGLHWDILRLYGDVLTIWRGWADDLRGVVIDSGHHMAEEAPEQLSGALIDFFCSVSSGAPESARPVG